MKNFDPDSGKWDLLDTGVVNWPACLRALSDDGYAGFLVIETHRHDSQIPESDAPALSELERNTRRNFELVQGFLRNLL